MKYIIYNRVNNYTYPMFFNSSEEARHWVINHLSDANIEIKEFIRCVK